MQETATAVAVPATLLGKPLGQQGLRAIEEEIRAAQPWTRAEIARRVCRRLGWTSPGGAPQLMSMRVALLRLERHGLIQLPPPRGDNGAGRKKKQEGIWWVKAQPIRQAAGELEGLAVEPADSCGERALYREVLERYHYLGDRPLPGAQIRYLVHCRLGLLGVLGFGAAVWKLAVRDRWIGWDEATRRRHLHLLVNNWRFLILPWVQSRNLASKILSRVAQRLPEDFQQRYGYGPVLLETFVDRERFAGVSYRAANWVRVGSTQGRGTKHRRGTPGVSVKDVWLYPLRPDFRPLLAEGRQ